MSDWNLRRRAGLCGSCSRPFSEDEAHYSLLRVSAGGLGREDHCVPCFANLGPQDSLVWWRTRQHAGQRGLVLDLESLESLFLALEGRVEESLEELRYLLCLLLMRKRRLKLARVVQPSAGEAGHELLIARRPRRTQEYRVRVFDLSTQRQQELKLELQRIFEGAEIEQLVQAASVPLPTPAPEAAAGNEPVVS